MTLPVTVKYSIFSGSTGGAVLAEVELIAETDAAPAAEDVGSAGP